MVSVPTTTTFPQHWPTLSIWIALCVRQKDVPVSWFVDATQSWSVSDFFVVDKRDLVFVLRWFGLLLFGFVYQQSEQTDKKSTDNQQSSATIICIVFSTAGAGAGATTIRTLWRRRICFVVGESSREKTSSTNNEKQMCEGRLWLTGRRNVAIQTVF